MYSSHPSQELDVIRSRYVQSESNKHVVVTRFAPMRALRRFLTRRQAR